MYRQRNRGARFELDYDSASRTWCGALTVPTSGGKPSVMTDKASGVFRLLSKLDGQYREIEGKPWQCPGGPTDQARLQPSPQS